MRIKILHIILAMLASVAFLSCDDNMHKLPEPVAVESITLNNKFANGYTLSVGKTTSIAQQVTVVPINATDKMETYASSDTNVATVDDAGLIRGKAKGTSVITITVGGKTAEFTLTVIDRIIYDVTEIQPAKDEFELDKDLTLDLFPQLLLTPVEASYLDLTFTSSDPGVAIVDEVGVVTGIDIGVTTITITSNYDSSVSVDITINVVYFVDDPDFVVDDNGKITAYNGTGGDLIVPRKATSMHNDVFQNKINVTSIDLQNVTTVGGAAFRNCSDLKKVIAPKVTKLIGNSFNNCSNLEEVVSPNLETIENAVFQDCAKLSKIDLSKVISVGQFAFSGTALTSIDMPLITQITNRKNQFAGCTKLVSVNLPSLTTIGADGIFSGCTSLKSISMPLFSTFGNFDQASGIEMFKDCSSLEKVDLPLLTGIKSKMFSGCTSLETLKLPEVTSEWDNGNVIEKCSSLKVLIIPKVTTIKGKVNASNLATLDISGVETISGNDNFQNLAINTLNMPKLKSIGLDVFRGCNNLNSITLPATMTIFSGGAFSGCANLTDINVDSANPDFTSEGGVLYNKDKSTIVAYPSGRTTGFTTPASVTKVARSAFSKCAITSLSLPEVTHIVQFGLYSCTSLTSLSTPKVSIVEGGGLREITSLTKISLPSLTKLDKNAFQGITNMIIDLHGAINLSTAQIDGGAIPDVGGITIYVYNDAAKAKFTGTNYVVKIGTAP